MEPNQSPTTKSKYQNQDLQDQIEDVLQNQSPKEALKLLQRLTEMENAGSFDDQLKEQQQRLRVVAMSLLPMSKLLAIFQGKLEAVLEFNVNERLKTRFVSMPAEEQDDLKKQIYETLRANNLRFVAGDVKSSGQWVRAYRESGQSVDTFVKQSKDFNKLSIEDQLKVQRLLRSIDLLTTSSASPEGMQDELVVRDESGHFKVLRSGELFDLGFDAGGDGQAKATEPIQAQPFQPAPTSKKETVFEEIKREKSTMSRPAIAPPPPTISKPSASFYFNTDDEAEVQQHRTKLADIGPSSGTNLDQVVFQLAKEYNISFTDKLIEERFGNIIKSRLRDVRDLIETKNMLTRPVEVGGVGLSEQQATPLLSQLEEEVIKVHQQPTTPPPAPVEPKPTPEPPKPIPQKPITPPKPPVVEPPKPEPPKPQPLKPVKPVKIEPKPIAVKKSKKVSEEIPVVKRPSISSRPTVSDIKPPIKTIGPIEELAELKLQDYRKLGETAEEANEKIIEKLGLLEEDSYLKRAEGIKAWKKSEVYKVYLNIGRESMEKDMAIIDVIRQRKEDGRPYLTKEEFQAIADLNKKISF